MPSAMLKNGWIGKSLMSEAYYNYDFEEHGPGYYDRAMCPTTKKAGWVRVLEAVLCSIYLLFK